MAAATPNYSIRCPRHLMEDQQVDKTKITQNITSINNSVGWDHNNEKIMAIIDQAKQIYVLVLNNEVKGYVAIRGLERGSKDCYIRLLAVNAADQKAGFGRALMNRVFQKAEKYGLEKVTLDFRANKQNLVKFYNSFPYEIISEYQGYYVNGDPKLAMEYNLKNKKTS